MHAGHFKHHRLNYDPFNINAQCPKCNLYGSGKLDIYAEKLESLYGPGIIQELSRRAQAIKKYTRQELEDVIEIYTKKLANGGVDET